MTKYQASVLAILFSAFTFVNACGDDNSKTNTKDPDVSKPTEKTCQKDHKICENDVLKVCNDGHEYVVSDDCASRNMICDSDSLQCKESQDNTPKCSDNDKKCEQNVLKICYSGDYVDLEKCADKGQTCDTETLTCVGGSSSTTENCTTDEKICQSGILKQCQGNGEYATLEDCTQKSQICDENLLACRVPGCLDAHGQCEPKPESRDTSDDSDVLDGVELPQKNVLPDDACFQCKSDQHCMNGECKSGTRHNIHTPVPITSESGDTLTLTLSSHQRPTADVTFECTIVSESPFPEASVVCDDKWTSADEDWFSSKYGSATRGVPVRIKGLPDHVDDGDQKYYLILKTISEDPQFNGAVHAPLELTNRNIDTAGVSYSSDTTLITSESGAVAEFNLVLNSKPLAPVKLKLRSSDLSEGTVSPKSLIFTPDNWDTPQKASVTGVNDEIADLTVTYHVLVDAISVDSKYNKEDVLSIPIVNIDDDSPSLSVTAKQTRLTPSQSSTQIAVGLGKQPDSEVKISFDTSPNLFTYSPSEIVFSPSDWQSPKTVTVSYDKDSEVMNQAFMEIVVYAKASSDGTYQDILSNMLAFTALKYDSFVFGYTGHEEKVTVTSGIYKLEAWGSQGSGTFNGTPGYGGYSYATVTFPTTTDLYINVGGVPYNGGWGSGGGATHIATVSGLLKDLSAQQDKVLIVAGGGGGAERSPGGYGGGETGGDGSPHSTVTSEIPTGGSQTEGGKHGTDVSFGTGGDGSFGQGGDGTGQAHPDDPEHMDGGPGGGGGWYGGGGIPYAGGAGGGSGHVKDGLVGETIAGNQGFVSPTGGEEIGHAGTGYARISVIEEEVAN